ncbi:MAG: Transcription termination factor Rho [Actinomycetota bacterium]
MAAEALEQSMLESKDKDQLLAIAQALGIKTNARASKATLIDRILETTGVSPSSKPAPAAAPPATADADAGSSAAAGDHSAVDEVAGGAVAEVVSTDSEPEVVLGPDGEPLSDWEVELLRKGEIEMPPPAPAAAAGGSNGASASGDDGDDDDDEDDGDALPGESRNARRRRRRRNKNRGEGQAGPGATEPQRTSDQRGDQRTEQRGEPGVAVRDSGPDLVNHEPVEVSGYLDLRDEGYGFLRVNGYLPSRDDAYVPVRLARQYGLRRGDHLTGMCRPAGRNEKNPALLEVHSVNGDQPDTARDRRRFEDLTALFPDTRLRLEHSRFEMTSRIIDLVAPIGKGQRGLIVSPPKAGKTSIMKTIATAIEHNHPEVVLMVLLVDERPEEVTDMRRSVKGEVIASTFDRPSDEHVHVAELAVERAKRLVEAGKDVVMIVDGITRLTRAYNLAAPPSGRILSGGIDAAALYPPKKLFGAARNVEEGGSLTILATALVDTNSRMDDAIFEEFKGTGNMELKLDRRLAERRVFPAIDVDGSSTRHEELLFDRKQLQQAWKLRRVLSGLTDGGNAAAAIELLCDRLQSFATNADFLAEIGKQGS